MAAFLVLRQGSRLVLVPVGSLMASFPVEWDCGMGPALVRDLIHRRAV